MKELPCERSTVDRGRSFPRHVRNGRGDDEVHPAFDAESYKSRNVVERSCNLLKQWRGLATRFGKLAIVYRSAVLLATVLTWAEI